MTSSIVVSSLGLFAAVTVLYQFAWLNTKDLLTSQTVAFNSWLIGNVFLALNMRSERQPFYQLGLTSNRLMVIWATLVAIFLFTVSIIPGAQVLIKVSSLTGAQWGMILVATFIGTFWMEIKKIITFRGGVKL